MTIRGVTVQALLSLISLGLAACAHDLGREWESVEVEQATIVFNAPGLHTQKPRVLRSYNEQQSVFVENIIWVGPQARHAKAMVQFARTSPGYYLRSKTDPRDLLDRLGFFEHKEITYGALQSDVNAIGRVEYRRLNFDDVSCVAFVQVWGLAEGAGDRQLAGYYCADPGSAFDDYTLGRVIQTLRLRDD